MSSSRYLVSCITACLSVLGCSPDLPVLESVEPGEVSVDELPRAALVRGSHLEGGVSVSLDDNGPPELSTELHAFLGEIELPSASRLSSREIEIELPASLELETYDLRVELGGGKSATLPSAISIIASRGDQTLDTLTTASAPDGGKGVIDRVLDASSGGGRSRTRFGPASSTATVEPQPVLANSEPSSTAPAPAGTTVVDSGTGSDAGVTAAPASTKDAAPNAGISLLAVDAGVDAGRLPVDSGRQTVPDGGDAGAGLTPPALDQLAGFWSEFETPQKLAISELGQEADPWLTTDRLELYFRSERTGNRQIWVARRATPADDWSAPEEVTVLSTLEKEGGPTLTPDGLLMLFHRRTGDANPQIYQTTRSGLDAPWQPAQRVNWNNFNLTFLQRAKLDETGSYIHLTFDANTFTGDLYYGEFIPGTQTTLSPESSINTTDDEFDALSRMNRRLLLFSRGPDGARDLYWATRPSEADPYSAPQPITPLNTPGEEDGLYITPELDLIIFTRDDELYESYRFGARP